MDKKILEFAEKLILNVRDRAIENCSMNLSKKSDYATAERWQTKIKDSDFESIKNEIIPDCVDDAIFFLLNSIDHALINLSYISDSGEKINLTDSGFGELGGWYMGSDSWREKFSKQRINDDLKDLNLEDIGL